MPLLEVQLDFSEPKKLLEAFRKVDPTPIMQVAAEMLVTAVSDRYQSEGDGEWPPHAASTVASMGPHQLMQYTGIAAGSTAADWGPDFAEAYSAIEYLQYHLEDGRRNPKRNPFELTDEALDPIKDFIVQDFGRRLGEAA